MIFNPINVVIPKLKVNIIWLVTVKVYGIIPKVLQPNTKTKVVKSKGKNFEPLLPKASKTIFCTNSKIISVNDCHLFGIKVLFKLQRMKRVKTTTTVIKRK